MTRHVRRLLFVAAVVVLALYVPRARPSTETPQIFALTTGVVAGISVFTTLAGRLRPPPLATPHVARTVGLLAPRVLAGAAGEELFWRYLVLCSVAKQLGFVAGIALSTLAFAGAHYRRGFRTARAHLFTGAAFGALYVATGRLAAAVAAHVTYNVLVVAASASWNASDVAPESAR